MATDYTGQRLLFTSRMTQAGTDQPSHGKLFIADERGIQPLTIYGKEILSTEGMYPGQPGLLTNFYDIDFVSVSADGRMIAVSAWRNCDGRSVSLCGINTHSTVYDSSGSPAFEATGEVKLSPNGRFGLSFGTYIANVHNVLDFQTGRAVAGMGNTSAPGLPRHGIANDGTVAYSYNFELLILRPNRDVEIPTPEMPAEWAAIDAAASTVVWAHDGLHVARITDLTHPINIGDANDTAPQISHDGSRILFFSGSQLSIVNADGTDRRAITKEPDGVAQAVLSGSGKVVWVLTAAGRLFKLDIDSGVRSEYPEPLVGFRDRSAWGTRGQVVSVQASVLPNYNVEITIGGQPVSAPKVGQGMVEFQIPWQLSATTAPVLTIRNRDSVNWSGDTLPISITETLPRIVAVAHEDFSARVTASNPPRPGEIIHLFGTGWGPVTPTVPDGQPAPASPLSTTVMPVTCNGLPVLFAGPCSRHGRHVPDRRADAGSSARRLGAHLQRRLRCDQLAADLVHALNAEQPLVMRLVARDDLRRAEAALGVVPRRRRHALIQRIVAQQLHHRRRLRGDVAHRRQVIRRHHR